MLEHLAHYNILDRIGAGGMGEVFRARDTRVGRTVAIKVLPDSIARDDERRRQFLQDARAAAALSHPNIAALYEVVDQPDQLFLVFEYVPGESLRTMLAGRPINARRAIHVAAQIADALADAHALGVAHGDVRPDTVIVTPKGNAKLLDFGFAAWTNGGAAPGHAADERADIVALGALLHEMLTGAPPARAVTAAGSTQPVGSLPAPSAINKAAPKELDAIVSKALAKHDGPRYESPATIAAELRAIDGTLAARAESAVPANSLVVHARSSRSSMLWLVLAIAALVLVASVWYERAWLLAAWRDVMTPPAPR